ncbi:MAG: glycosyltransferase [Promethearchaeia archaeon]
MRKEEILFLSHNIRHQRCHYLASTLGHEYSIVAPKRSAIASSRLSLSTESASNMLYLGLSAFGYSRAIHLDGIDVFIYPFFRNGRFLHDYHVPLVDELRWLGLDAMAAVAYAILPESIKKAEVIIAPNSKMLAHAGGYAKLPEHYVIPNYPPESFHVDITQEEARASLGLPLTERIGLFVGGARLKSIYGIDLLLRTWKEVARKRGAKLYIVGPTNKLHFDTQTYSNLRKKGIILTGKVHHTQVPMWIAAADLCLSQRTPGFPVNYYNIHDSLKLSEYALFEKPIVAAGYSAHPDYISSKTDVESYANAILRGFDGEAPKPTPHTWEENIPTIRKAYKSLINS